MKILNEKKKIQFALDLGNLDVEKLRLGDVINLKDGFIDYGMAITDADFNSGLISGKIPHKTLLFQVQDEDFIKAEREMIVDIQTKLRRYLDSLSAENFLEANAPKQIEHYLRSDRSRRSVNDIHGLFKFLSTDSQEERAIKTAIRDSWKQTELDLFLSGARGVTGPLPDMFVFQFKMLLSKLEGKIFKCPQCTKYFLQRGTKRFCTPRCQVNWANKKYYRSKQAKNDVLELHREKGLSAKTIVERLKHKHELNESTVSSWIEKSASVRRSKNKRRK